MFDARPADFPTALHPAAILIAATLAVAAAPAAADGRPGQPLSLLPRNPTVATPAPATAPFELPPASREAAHVRHPVSPVLYIPPAPGRPGLTARVAAPRGGDPTERPR